VGGDAGAVSPTVRYSGSSPAFCSAAFRGRIRVCVWLSHCSIKGCGSNRIAANAALDLGHRAEGVHLSVPAGVVQSMPSASDTNATPGACSSSSQKATTWAINVR